MQLVLVYTSSRRKIDIEHFDNRPCQNAEKIITETENPRKIIIVKISIAQKKVKLRKMLIPEITNSPNLKKTNFEIAEI